MSENGVPEIMTGKYERARRLEDGVVTEEMVTRAYDAFLSLHDDIAITPRGLIRAALEAVLVRADVEELPVDVLAAAEKIECSFTFRQHFSAELGRLHPAAVEFARLALATQDPEAES